MNMLTEKGNRPQAKILSLQFQNSEFIWSLISAAELREMKPANKQERELDFSGSV